MFKISGEAIIESGSNDEIKEKIKKYLTDRKLTLVNDEGNPIDEQELMAILEGNQSYHFKSKKTDEFVNGFILSIDEYTSVVNNFTINISNLSDAQLLNAFSDLITSLIEVEKAASYFEVDFYNIDELNKFAKNVMERYSLGDIDYLKDIIEYEILPYLEVFSKKISERFVQ